MKKGSIFLRKLKYIFILIFAGVGNVNLWRAKIFRTFIERGIKKPNRASFHAVKTSQAYCLSHYGCFYLFPMYVENNAYHGIL